MYYLGMGLASYIRKTRSGISKMAEQEIPGLVPTTETDLTTINRHKYLHATPRVQVRGYSILVQHRNEKRCIEKGKNSFTLSLSLLPKSA